ncbi:MAG TPA: hypothetical protein VMN79_03615 [Casimicrobiaceae bacterium]|nr:hypothetical protein [Casimicrobiaceae bacterium]
MRSLRRFVPCLVAALAACASTTIVDSWYDAGYRGGPFKRIMILAVTDQEVARRTFEDTFSAKLRAAGTDAVASYQLLPQSGRTEEPALDAAARRADADGLLMVHLVRVDRQTRVVPGYPAPFYPGYYGYYRAWAAYPDVYTYDIATAEANLFSVASRQLVWGGTTETFNPQSVSRDSAVFADVVIAALAKRGLVPGAK